MSKYFLSLVGAIHMAFAVASHIGGDSTNANYFMLAGILLFLGSIGAYLDEILIELRRIKR